MHRRSQRGRRESGLEGLAPPLLHNMFSHFTLPACLHTEHQKNMFVWSVLILLIIGAQSGKRARGDSSEKGEWPIALKLSFYRAMLAQSAVMPQ